MTAPPCRCQRPSPSRPFSCPNTRNLVLKGGVLRYTGADTSTDRRLTFNNTPGNGIDVSTAGVTLTLTGAHTGTGGFAKTGASTLLLTGSSTLTGDTRIRTENAGNGISGSIPGNFGLEINGKLSEVLTLSGANVYTGNTIVNDGTLTLSSTSQLGLVVGDKGVNSSLRGSGSVELDGKLSLNLAGADPTVGNSWTLIDVDHLNETFGDSFSVSTVTDDAFDETTPGVWSMDDGSHTWTFTEGTGVLRVGGSAASPYDTWASIQGLDGSTGKEKTFDADPDGDGGDNGLEWILGGNPLLGNLALVKATGDGSTGLTLAFDRNPESISATTLAVEWNTTLSAFANAIPISTNDVPPNGTNPTVDIDAPVVGKVIVNIPAANAGAGRIFARLKAIQN